MTAVMKPERKMYCGMMCSGMSRALPIQCTARSADSVLSCSRRRLGSEGVRKFSHATLTESMRQYLGRESDKGEVSERSRGSTSSTTSDRH